MNEIVPFHKMLFVLNKRPKAVAYIHGGGAYSQIFGYAYFYQMSNGVMVAVQVTGLPKASVDSPNQIFGFHIHSGANCSGTKEDPFANTLTHYNPTETLHPEHAGDLPPLFGNEGYAFQLFFTDRFSVEEILNKTIVIHAKPDDFTSQPAGNAGEKIACGEIQEFAFL